MTFDAKKSSAPFKVSNVQCMPPDYSRSEISFLRTKNIPMLKEKNVFLSIYKLKMSRLPCLYSGIVSTQFKIY